ncbi:unnamed protein product [Prunus armeniaca]
MYDFIVCEMDKSWMHADRRSKAYELGVEGFLNFDNDLDDIGFDPYEFANVIGDGDQPLYPGSKLLILQGDLLPKGNTLPSSMYEAKKTLPALGMSYEKIHAFPITASGIGRIMKIQVIVLLVVSQGGRKANI